MWVWAKAMPAIDVLPGPSTNWWHHDIQSVRSRRTPWSWSSSPSHLGHLEHTGEWTNTTAYYSYKCSSWRLLQRAVLYCINIACIIYIYIHIYYVYMYIMYIYILCIYHVSSMANILCLCFIGLAVQRRPNRQGAEKHARSKCLCMYHLHSRALTHCNGVLRSIMFDIIQKHNMIHKYTLSFIMNI